MRRQTGGSPGSRCYLSTGVHICPGVAPVHKGPRSFIGRSRSFVKCPVEPQGSRAVQRDCWREQQGMGPVTRELRWHLSSAGARCGPASPPLKSHHHEEGVAEAFSKTFTLRSILLDHLAGHWCPEDLLAQFGDTGPTVPLIIASLLGNRCLFLQRDSQPVYAKAEATHLRKY